MRGNLKVILKDGSVFEIPSSYWIPSYFFIDDLEVNSENRYIFFKRGLLINNDFIVICDETVKDGSYKVTLLSDDEGNYELEIEDSKFQVFNPSKRKLLNEYVTVKNITVMIDCILDETYAPSKYFIDKFNGFYIVDELSDGLDISTTVLSNSTKEINPNNFYQISSLEFEVNTSDIKFSNITINYVFGFGNKNNQNSLEIITKDIIPIGTVVNIDSVEWIIVSMLYDNGVIKYNAVPKTLFHDTINIDYIDNTKCDGVDLPIKVRIDNKTADTYLEEPFINSNDIEEYVMSSTINSITLIEDIKSNDIVLPHFDFDSGDIDYLTYGELSDSVDIDESWNVINRTMKKKMVTNRIMLHNQLKKPILPVEYKFKVNDTELVTDIGSFLFASDGDDSDDLPVSRFTFFYDARVQFTQFQSNLVGVENGKFKLIDGEYIYVPPNITQADTNAMSPEHIIKLASAKPIIPTPGNYIDSLLPQLIPWSSSIVNFSVFRDKTGNLKLLPTKREFKLFNSDVIKKFINDNKLYWTKTLAVFKQLSNLGNIGIQHRFVISQLKNYKIDDETTIPEFQTIECGDQISPLSMMKIEDSMMTFTDSYIFEYYVNNDYKPPFHCHIQPTTSNDDFVGCFYEVKFINKKMLENASKGFAFRANIDKYLVIIDLNSNEVYIYQVQYDGTGNKKYIGVDYGSDWISDIYSDDKYIRLTKVEFKEFTNGDKTVNLLPMNIERLIIIPDKRERIECHVFIKMLSYYFYFANYNFASKSYVGIPYVTKYDDSDTSTTYGLILTQGKTYYKLRKLVNPEITEEIILEKVSNVTDLTSITKNLGLDKFPVRCKLKNVKRDYMISKITHEIIGDKCKTRIVLDDRNKYLDELSESKEDDYSILPRFELRRRLCNFGVPSEYIWKPPCGLDTYIKTKLYDILTKTHLEVNNIDDIDIKIRGAYKLPSSIMTTLDGIIDNHRFVTVFDCSILENRAIDGVVYESLLPFQMEVDMSVYVGTSFDYYTLLYDGDKGIESYTIDLVLEDVIGLSKFVYPNKDVTSVSFDLRTTVPTFATLFIDSYKRNSVNPNVVTKLSNGSTDRVLKLKYKLPNMTNYNELKINVFSLRPDNPSFYIWDREDLTLVVEDLVTNTVTNIKMDEDNKNSIEDGKHGWIFYVKASTSREDLSEDVAKSFNANSITLQFLDKETENRPYKYSLLLPYSNRYIKAKASSVINNAKPILYIRVSKKCYLECNTSIGSTKLLLVPGICLALPLTDFEGNWIDPNNPNLKITDITPGTVIELFGIQFYSEDGFMPRISEEYSGGS